MYNNYHKNFRISSEICIVVMTSAFCLLMSAKNRHFSSFSLAALNAAKFGPKYYIILIILTEQICSWRVTPTSNLRVEQNLMHLGRFIHFSQKVVGV